MSAFNSWNERHGDKTGSASTNHFTPLFMQEFIVNKVLNRRLANVGRKSIMERRSWRRARAAQTEEREVDRGRQEQRGGRQVSQQDGVVKNETKM